MISLQERLFEYCWSSYRWYAAQAERPSWFEPRRVLGVLGLDDTRAGRRAYAERMRQRAVDELSGARDAENEALRGGCAWQAGFRERMLALIETAGEKLSRHKAVDGTPQP